MEHARTLRCHLHIMSLEMALSTFLGGQGEKAFIVQSVIFWEPEKYFVCYQAWTLYDNTVTIYCSEVRILNRMCTTSHRSCFSLIPNMLHSLLLSWIRLSIRESLYCLFLWKIHLATFIPSSNSVTSQSLYPTLYVKLCCPVPRAPMSLILFC